MLNKQVIVSVASWRPRFQTIIQNLQSLVNQDYPNKHIILNIHQDDERFLPEEVVNFCLSNCIEINIIRDINLRSHNKYYYVMLKHRDRVIITVDDDFVYDSRLISSLMSGYLHSDKRTIICPTCLQITSNNGKLLTFKEIQIVSKLTTSLPHLYNWPRGGGGILYPPNILNLSEDSYKEFLNNDLIHDDDCYLKIREIKQSVLCKQLDLGHLQTYSICDRSIDDSALYSIYGYNMLNSNLLDHELLFLNISHKLNY